VLTFLSLVTSLVYDRHIFSVISVKLFRNELLGVTDFAKAAAADTEPSHKSVVLALI
jgi:hypothetical protein